MSPCQSCGACCASFRVDFHAAELAGGAYAWDAGVPRELAVPVIGETMRMLGTDAAPPRCAALRGEIGRAVDCVIYSARPSPCREFDIEHDACRQARQIHGVDAFSTAGNPP